MIGWMMIGMLGCGQGDPVSRSSSVECPDTGVWADKALSGGMVLRRLDLHVDPACSEVVPGLVGHRVVNDVAAGDALSSSMVEDRALRVQLERVFAVERSREDVGWVKRGMELSMVGADGSHVGPVRVLEDPKPTSDGWSLKVWMGGVKAEISAGWVPDQIFLHGVTLERNARDEWIHREAHLNAR